MNKQILMVGSSLEVKGGMTTVVEGFLNNEFRDFDLYYIPTHIEKSRIKQLIFYSISIIKILIYIMFKQISIVHIHFSERGSFLRKNLILKLCKVFNKKTIIHMHGAEFKQYYNNSREARQKDIVKFLSAADRVIVLGDSWHEFVSNLDKKIKIEVMPNFVSCVEEKATYENNTVNIIFLAVLIKRKGIFDLIEAINLITKEYEWMKDRINVIIAGTGIEEDKVKEKVKELKLEDKFDFKGWIGNEEKKELLKEGQIFVLPSYNEGLPVSILEAMSYGLPIISTNVGSIEDAVKDGYNGIIINAGDINQLKRSIIELIENKDMWSEYSNNSKYLVEEKYSKEKYFEMLEKIYNLI